MTGPHTTIDAWTGIREGGNADFFVKLPNDEARQNS
jgi:hypothetical protein